MKIIVQVCNRIDLVLDTLVRVVCLVLRRR